MSTVPERSCERDFPQLLKRSRAGCENAFGDLCEPYRDVLRYSTTGGMPSRLRAKADQSDLIQQTFLSAFARFDSFQGSTEREWLAWLLKIFERTQLNFIRSYRATHRRNLALERSFTELDQQSRLPDTRNGRTPSGIVSTREQFELLLKALDRIPEDYRIAIELRHREQLAFAEIGKRMGRTPEASRKLWTRGVRLLAQILQESEDGQNA